MRAMKASEAVGKQFRVVNPMPCDEVWFGMAGECFQVLGGRAAYPVCLTFPLDDGDTEDWPFSWDQLDLVEADS